MGPHHAHILRFAMIVVVGTSGCTVVGYPSARGGSTPMPVAPAVPEAEPSRSNRIVTRNLPAEAGAPGTEPRSERGNPEAYEIDGRTYRVMGSADGYDAVGIASWYGQEFAGRPTSSGEIYDPDLLTAAHRTLPLPTWVEVTNLDNGSSVLVRVNDRGPFAHPDERIIDVSQAAARRLGLIGTGTARVRVRAVSRQ
ncbi:MAG TPA: septal ring lytic transglycosylase RlpA family protein [Longimicrobiales bacterium]|jgi:rare lipoprotein A (peptidoglycan hydrolase)